MKIEISDYPQLQALCWFRKQHGEIDEQDALQIYDRNWRHINRRKLAKPDITFIRSLKERYGAALIDI
ncbi:hypothetical protein [Pseudophaeobacter sp. TrK17]|uniref:hypothetical protein n=1 Tax=Pseudophaeobacter sp. TrK17 TaxID=2815167 RepID=UPI0035CEA3A4